MAQEDKDLLLKDLCGRLQYGLKCSIYRVDDFGVGWRDATFNGIVHNDIGCEFYFDDYVCIDSINKVKPYLFPMSSMTEEQKEEFNTHTFEIMFCEVVCKKNKEIEYGKLMAFDLDFYNKHHLDWRGLIPMGLAIDATELGIY